MVRKNLYLPLISPISFSACVCEYLISLMCWLSYVSRRNIAVAAEIRQLDGFRFVSFDVCKVRKKLGTLWCKK